MQHTHSRWPSLHCRETVALTLLGLCTLLYAGAVGAAESGAQPDASEQSDEKKGLQQVVVTAASGSDSDGYRSERAVQLGPLGATDLIDTPLSLNIIPADLIRNRVSSTPDDLFRINPVTQLSNSQSRFFSAVNLRGFDVSSSKRVDEIPDTTTSNVDIEDKEQVEVLTGLSGFLYGPGNVGGTVNYVLKRPTAARLVDLSVSNNGGGNFTGHADLGGPIDPDGRFGYRLNLVGQRGDTNIDFQSIRRSLYSGALDWHISESAVLRVDGSVSRYHMEGTDPYWSVDPGVPYPSAPDASRYYGQPATYTQSRQSHAGVRFEWAINDVFSVRSAVARHDSHLRLAAANNEITSASGDYTAMISQWLYPDYVHEGAYLYADAVFHTGPLSHRLTAGYSGDRTRSTEYIGSDWTVLSGFNIANPTYTSVEPGIPTGHKYVDTRLRNDNLMFGDQIVFESWTALLGLTQGRIRADFYDETGAFSGARYDQHKLSPAAALLFKVDNHLSLYGNYMRGFEMGGTAAATYNGYDVVNANQVMPPTLSRQFEVGAKYSLHSLLLTAALFDIDRAFEFYNISTPTAPVYVQDGREVHRGVEFTVTGRATADLTLLGGVTLLNPKIKKNASDPELEGKVPMNVARYMAKLYAEYSLPYIRGLTMTGGVYYTSQQQIDELNTASLPSYTTADLGLRYTRLVADQKLTLRMNVTNLTDSSYWLSTTALAPPRTIVFSADVEL